MSTWGETSAAVVGLCIEGRLASESVNKANLMPPFDEAFAEFKKTGDVGLAMDKVGLDIIQNALDRSKQINGTSKLADWVAMLERAKNNYEAGEILGRMSKKLLQGDQVDWARVSSIATKATIGIGNGFTSLSDITAMNVPFKKTGFAAVDKHFGGIPEIGQVIIGAKPGGGKTTFMLQLAACWVKTHPTETVIIYTLEMTKEELKMRLLELAKLTPEEMDRIVVEDAPISVEETLSKAATIENRGLMCIDFIDLLVQDESNESAYSHIYKQYMLGAKSLRIPIIVLVQLSYKYVGGIPRPFHIRYTSLAYALAWMLLMLYNPNDAGYKEANEEEFLPTMKDMAYIVAWKARGGFRPENGIESVVDATTGELTEKKNEKLYNGLPRAIQVPYKGSIGWHFGHGGKLYMLDKLT